MEVLGACNREAHIRYTRGLWLLIALGDLGCKMWHCNLLSRLHCLYFPVQDGDGSNGGRENTRLSSWLLYFSMATNLCENAIVDFRAVEFLIFRKKTRVGDAKIALLWKSWKW